MYRQSEKKNLLNSNTSSTCPGNMVNFGLLTAEIRWRVWGTPSNFNGFRVLAATARHSSSGRQPNFAALNRGRHLYSAGRPSRWTLAHISSNPSSPSAVGYKLSSMRNTSHSLTYSSGVSHRSPTASGSERRRADQPRMLNSLNVLQQSGFGINVDQIS